MTFNMTRCDVCGEEVTTDAKTVDWVTACVWSPASGERIQEDYCPECWGRVQESLAK